MNSTNMYKAWVNVKTKIFELVPITKTHYDFVAEHPKTFNLDNLTNLVVIDGELVEVGDIDEKRFLEDSGWVAVSIKKTDTTIEANVSAITVKNVLTAARLLYKRRHKYGSWDVLKINTEIGSFVFKGSEKIIEYIVG